MHESWRAALRVEVNTWRKRAKSCGAQKDVSYLQYTDLPTVVNTQICVQRLRDAPFFPVRRQALAPRPRIRRASMANIVNR